MNTDELSTKQETEALNKHNVSGSLPDKIEKLAIEIEKRYNECNFWKRGHIYADGFRNGAKCALRMLEGNDR